MLAGLPRDARLLMASRGLRAFAFSYLNVVFAIYLDRLGYSTLAIGVVFSVAYLSGALLTAAWGHLSDRLGRRRILILLAALTIVSNAIFIFFSSLFFILLAVVIANVGAGGQGGGGSGGGPFNPVEEALLAEKCTPENRNQIFALNSFVGSLMGAVGALAAGLPQYLQESWGWEAVASYKPLFLLTVVLSAVLALVYRAIGEEHRPAAAPRKISRATGVFVTKMSLLAVVDNFGAGLAGALVPYWFFLRFGVELKSLGLLFFVSYFLAALSFLSAPVAARRLGVVRTMAFSHAVASSLYLAIPFAPTFGLASVLLAIRSYFAYMDNPLRASFTMAMVGSAERGSAAGVTSLARQVPFGISPTVATYLMESVSLTLPLFIGGGLQLANDVAFYLMFRDVKPPEEIRRASPERSGV
ncbi:MAG TPA: MFS transporter [candidate division Zixibacteria bacterium]|nr:MFS transporter [candidate division Zixibacteria bacterium]